jgi:hypothetical protein
MQCFHTDSTRTDMVAATMRWTCEQLGLNLSRAIDYVFDTQGPCPPCVLVSESLIDEFAPPLEWSLKRGKWWDRTPTIPRPHLEGENRQDSRDDYQDPLSIDHAAVQEGEQAGRESMDDVSFPEISVEERRTSLVMCRMLPSKPLSGCLRQAERSHGDSILPGWPTSDSVLRASFQVECG